MDNGVENAMTLRYILVLWSTIAATSQASCPPAYHRKDPTTCYRPQFRSASRQAAATACTHSLGGALVTLRSEFDLHYYRMRMHDYGMDRAWLGARLEESSHPEWRYVADQRVLVSQGCYKYDVSDTDFIDVDTSAAFPSDTLTRDKCLGFCEDNGYLYAALHAGTDCLCASDFSDTPYSSGADPGGGCDEMCVGDTATGADLCGGRGYVSVYRVGGSGFDEWAREPDLKPNNVGGYQSCGAMDLSHAGGLLNDLNCTDKRPYICQTSDRRYKLVNVSRDWFEARYDCIRSYGGDLTSLPDRATWNNIRRTLATAETYLVGLVNRRWLWGDGSDVLYTSWREGEPHKLDHGCAYMEQTGRWRETPCMSDVTMPYFCEITNIESTTTTTLTSTASMSSISPTTKIYPTMMPGTATATIRTTPKPSTTTSLTTIKSRATVTSTSATRSITITTPATQATTTTAAPTTTTTIPTTTTSIRINVDHANVSSAKAPSVTEAESTLSNESTSTYASTGSDVLPQFEESVCGSNCVDKGLTKREIGLVIGMIALIALILIILVLICFAKCVCCKGRSDDKLQIFESSGDVGSVVSIVSRKQIDDLFGPILPPSKIKHKNWHRKSRAVEPGRNLAWCIGNTATPGDPNKQLYPYYV